MNYSPLRYPGGKARIVPIVQELIKNISPKNLNFGTILGIKTPTKIPNRIAIIICFHNTNFFIILSPSQYFISPS